MINNEINDTQQVDNILMNPVDNTNGSIGTVSTSYYNDNIISTSNNVDQFLDKIIFVFPIIALLILILPIVIINRTLKGSRKKEFNKKINNGDKIFCESCHKEIKDFNDCNGYSFCKTCQKNNRNSKQNIIRLLFLFSPILFVILAILILALLNNHPEIISDIGFIFKFLFGIIISIKIFLFSGPLQSLLCFVLSLILPFVVYKYRDGFETRPQIIIFIFLSIVSLFTFLVFLISLIKYLWQNIA